MKRGEERITERLGENVSIMFKTSLDEKTLAKITDIDHEKFRTELWYSSEELLESSINNDCICLIVQHKETPIAFLIGYSESFDTSWFFLHEVATKIERKGIGKVLIVLLMVYCIENDYRFITLYTEEEDQQGRKLKEFYEHLGFKYMETKQRLGVVMRYDINKGQLEALARACTQKAARIHLS